MNYLYTEKELEYARYMKANPPMKIWWDFVWYVFDYGDFHFRIESVSEVADTQNKSDEAIIGQFTKHEEAYLPGKNSTLVCENKMIDQIYIVRVLLFFSTFRQYSGIERMYNIFKQKLKEWITGKQDTFGKYLASATGGGEEITCHPRSIEAQKADPRYSNLIDCGLLLEIDGKLLEVFVESNGYAFHVWNNKFFHEMEDVKRIAGQYELIKV